jgi:hypothetical protein
MATFVVQVNELIIHTTEVEASTEEEARQLGIGIILDGPDTLYNTDSDGIQAIYVYGEND